MIDWDMVQEVAKHKADAYAKKWDNDQVKYTIAFNAYHAGYMENAAERESLRVIASRITNTIPDLEGKLDVLTSVQIATESEELDKACSEIRNGLLEEKVESLDGLI